MIELCNKMWYICWAKAISEIKIQTKKEGKIETNGETEKKEGEMEAM